MLFVALAVAVAVPSAWAGETVRLRASGVVVVPDTPLAGRPFTGGMRSFVATPAPR
jgi:hypothetical protein